MKLLGCDPRQDLPLQLIDDTGVEVVPMDELLKRSDFVSLHCDLNPTTRGLIGERELKLMKPTAVLINTSRGPVVQQAAIEKALIDGTIAGAGLDVFEIEPIPATSPLLKMDNVLLTPHLSQSSERAAHRAHWQVIRNVVELLDEWETRNANPQGVSR